MALKIRNPVSAGAVECDTQERHSRARSDARRATVRRGADAGIRAQII